MEDFSFRWDFNQIFTIEGVNFKSDEIFEKN